jgi:hypothetical protein
MRILLAALTIFLAFPFTILAQDPPKITITQSGPTAPGVILFTPGHTHLQIIDNSGQVIYQDGPSSYFDFKVQSLDGTLSYRQIISGNGVIRNLGRNYSLIETVEAIGYDEGVDPHELLKLAPGHWMYFIYDRITPFDLSAYGGLLTATLISTVIQEQQNGGVVFEWRDLDHVPITDSVADLTGQIVDYTHGNAFELDDDGNILASFRNTNQVLKINRQTGAVIWQLGGSSNQFNFTNDPGFALQHNIRQLDSGNITLFDNGEASRGYSRAVEYEIDESGMTITRTWEITGPHATCCGNAQRLGNGNTFINWGSAGVMSEYTAGGDLVWQAEFESGFTYRAFREEWPAWRSWLPLALGQ